MTKEQLELLADVLQTHFTPFGLRCSCAGQHPDCAGVREDEVTQIRMALLREITAYIKGFTGFDKRVPDAPHSKFCAEHFPMMQKVHPNDCFVCEAYFEGFGRGRSSNDNSPEG